MPPMVATVERGGYGKGFNDWKPSGAIFWPNPGTRMALERFLTGF